MVTEKFSLMECSALTRVILCLPALRSIERCGVVRPVFLPSMRMSHGGLEASMRMPLPPPAVDAVSFSLGSRFGAGSFFAVDFAVAFGVDFGVDLSFFATTGCGFGSSAGAEAIGSTVVCGCGC